MGINNSGQIVGYYVDASGANHGFVLSGGIYTALNDPIGDPGSTRAFGINATGQIVGIYNASGVGTSGFLYSGGTYTTLNHPLATNGT